MNVELLRKVRDSIAREPRQFIMTQVYGACPTVNCGTSACIAGWAIAHHFGMSPDESRRQGKHCDMEFEEIAALFDLPDDQNAYALFFDGMWPPDFYEAWCRANHLYHVSPYENREESKLLRQRIRAEIAVELIDRIIVGRIQCPPYSDSRGWSGDLAYQHPELPKV